MLFRALLVIDFNKYLAIEGGYVNFGDYGNSF